MKTQHGKCILAACSLLFLALGGTSAVRAVDVPSPHDGISCSLCHGGAQKISTSSQAPRTDKCLQCHTPDEPWQSQHQGLISWSDSACLTCHDFHGPKADPEGAVPEPRVALAMDSGHCVACHNGEGVLADLTPGHEVARDIYHGQPAALADLSPSEACLNCHGEGSTSAWQGMTEATLTFSHQASHAFGRPVRPEMAVHARKLRAELDPRLPLIDGRMECVTCHSLTAGTKSLLVEYANPYDLCLGCHSMQPDAPGSGLVATLVKR